MANLAVMESYEGMGVATVSCVSGCGCAGDEREMTTERHESPIVMWRFGPVSVSICCRRGLGQKGWREGRT